VANIKPYILFLGAAKIMYETYLEYIKIKYFWALQKTN
jgi:hypothetical protein